jgi:hypothetical protein
MLLGSTQVVSEIVDGNLHDFRSLESLSEITICDRIPTEEEIEAWADALPNVEFKVQLHGSESGFLRLGASNQGRFPNERIPDSRKVRVSDEGKLEIETDSAFVGRLVSEADRVFWAKTGIDSKVSGDSELQNVSVLREPPCESQEDLLRAG